MRTLTFLSAFLFGAAFAAPNAGTSLKSDCKGGKCNADNCARAVTGTRRGLATSSAHLADCSSFFQCTAYPATSIKTTTTTVYPVTQTATVFGQTLTQLVTYATVPTTVTTITSIQAVTQTSIIEVTDTEIVLQTTTINQNAKRGGAVTQAASNHVVCPSRVPSYASACSGTVRFSSACSCAGVTGKTKTMTTPVKTVTVTATGHKTVTVVNTEVVTSSVEVLTSVTAETTLLATIVDFITSTATIELTSVATVTNAASATPTVNAYCENGAGVNGLSAVSRQVGSGVVNMRIEGGEGTVYEGLIYTGPMYVSTPSGGTHLCDGTNEGGNPVPGPNAVVAIASGATLCGYSYDGTYSPSVDDIDMTQIGPSDANDGSGRVWGFLKNFQLTGVGGCGTEYGPNDDLLWAFDINDANAFLSVQPTRGSITMAPGEIANFQVIDGQSGNPVAGASFGGSISDSNGNAAYTAPTMPGTYRVKATKSGAIRSNAVIIEVAA